MSLIAPDDNFAVLAVLLVASAFGMLAERKGWFGRSPGVLITIVFTSLLVTFDVIPSASDPEVETPVYGFVFRYIVPFTIPLLLFNVDLKRIVRESGRLLGAFLIGAAGVALGAALAAWLIPFGAEGHKMAGVFTATYTGGSVNFMAVATALDFLDSPLFAAAVAVDVVFTNFFIIFLFALPGIPWLRRFYPAYVEVAEDEKAEVPGEATSAGLFNTQLMEKLMLALTISGVICALGYWVSPPLARWLGTDIALEILVITALIVILGNLIPRQLARLEDTAFQLGFLLLYLFLAVIGAASDIRAVIASTPSVLAFAAITLLVHLVFTLLGCRIFRVSLPEIALASCANVGGSTVAAPMAATFKMKKAVTPAILIGVLGTVVGTFLGVGIGLLLR